MKRLHTFDQHFLKNPKLVLELIGHSNITQRDLVYDLGAGTGIISSCLARRARQVVAVEKEPRVMEKLIQNTAKYQNVLIEKNDILKIIAPSETYKVFANIPFGVSSKVVQKFTSGRNYPAAIYLIVQKQFANKLLADNKHFTGQLGARLAPWWRVKIKRTLRRTDYWPHPNVDTVLMEMLPRKEPLLDEIYRQNYDEFVTKCFADQKYFASLKIAGDIVSAELRPSQLDAEKWVKLFLHLRDNNYFKRLPKRVKLEK